ncbi:MAG: thiopurine S-methyltransferase [Pseudomonadota bacterium]
MTQDSTSQRQIWLERWREGRIGWHEAEGSPLLRRYWPRLMRGSTVLVPLCGKSQDLVWLARQGYDVVGVELSEIAVRAFFSEQELDFENTLDGALQCYRATALPVRIYQGDYFEFNGGPFHAVFDRGSLIALPRADRPRYVMHTASLLEEGAYQLLVTLEYDDTVVQGPPYSVDERELSGYFPLLKRVLSRNDIQTGSPKFRNAGLQEVMESVWTSA